jgi:transcriptional regulator with XRE-family HTH domain
LRGGETVSEHDLAVGRRLAEARGKAGLSQTEVARRMGFAQSRVAKIEIGTRRLLFSEAIAFAQLYKVPLTDFVPD